MPRYGRKYIDERPDLTGFEWDQAMVDLGHNTTPHLNEEGECPRCTKLLKAARDRRYGMKKRGWVKYPIPPNEVGNIVENMDIIGELLGSSLYEYLTWEGVVYIRRVREG